MQCIIKRQIKKDYCYIVLHLCSCAKINKSIHFYYLRDCCLYIKGLNLFFIRLTFKLLIYYLHKGYHIGLYLIDNKRRILYAIKYESNSSKNFRSILCLTEKLCFLDGFDFIKSNVKRIYGSRQLENPFLIVKRLQKQFVIFLLQMRKKNLFMLAIT